jgi:hypothetical protein
MVSPFSLEANTMTCDTVKNKLGLFVDAELNPDECAKVREHLASCTACCFEVENLRAIAEALQPTEATVVPESLWPSIEAGLGAASSGNARVPTVAPRPRVFRLLTPTWIAAAAFVLAIGLGIWGISPSGPKARAAPIDFSVLLEELDLDPRQAFRNFLETYNAKPGSRTQAKRYARRLNFALPESLPGGFRLDEVYLVNFGGAPGVAASYFRGEEFLAAIFHPPVHESSYGTHEDYDCVVGKHRGHKVQAGEWKLVHVTDATTCRCVLSRLDETTELPPVLAAVLPE